jgi:hypothetical protein
LIVGLSGLNQTSTKGGEPAKPLKVRATLSGREMVDRLRSLDTKQRAVGIPWYEREDYSRVLEIMTDRTKLPHSFDEWLRTAELIERHAQGLGRPTIRAMIKSDAFTIWCSARRLRPNGDSRGLYASEAAKLWAEPHL